MKLLWIFLFSILFYIGYSQDNNAEVYGDFNLSLQSYQEDKLIGAETADEIILNNAYLNINYSKGNFLLGVRYESYLNMLEDEKNYRYNKQKND